MIRNYFITAIRNIRRNFTFSLLNLFGLTLGITFSLIIFLIVKHELSYDDYHKKASQIYRITMNRDNYNPNTSMAIAPAIRNDFPELEKVTQIWQWQSVPVKIGARRFEEKLMGFADKNFLSVFDYEWISGDPESALAEPNSVVLTESAAKKYFGTRDPIGQVMNLDNRFNIKVTGLIKDVRSNSHLSFGFLVSLETIKEDIKPMQSNFYWITDGCHAYVVLPKNYTAHSIEKRMKAFITKNWGKVIGKEANLNLQPLNQIHFDQRYLNNSYSAATSKEIYWALSAVAVFIILMAAINFINLSTSQSLRRAKEVGVRKVLGGNRLQLIMQFMSETSFLVILALTFSLAISYRLMPEIGTWLGSNISLSQLNHPPIIFWIIISTLLLILLSGLYPAFVQSAFSPVTSLKGKSEISKGGLTLRKGLVLLQFVISQVLIVATLIVAYQMDFFRNQDLGFNKEMVISFNIPDMKKSEALKQQLAGLTGIKEFCFASGTPVDNNFFGPYRAEQFNMLKDEVTELKYVDEKYFDLFGLKLLAGERISKANQKDTTYPLVVNETLIHRLGIRDPAKAIGKQIKLYGMYNARIMGVVKDFQSESKHKERHPIILFYMPQQFFTVCTKLFSNGNRETIGRIDKIWSKLFPENLFKYEFVDDHIAAQYRQEEKEFTAFKLFSSIAILIGCLGLYGLISFAAVQRTKEIGIRKVLGAGVSDIARLLSKNFLFLSFIASLIAFPLAWYFMNKWLQNFAYHIDLNIWVFVLAALSSMVIAVITISHQTIKAAIANPVKSLRTE